MFETKDYSLKVTIDVMDQNPVPINVVNLTVCLMFEAELPLLKKFIAMVDFAIANILDLYDQSTLPEIDIPEIETQEARRAISQLLPDRGLSFWLG